MIHLRVEAEAQSGPWNMAVDEFLLESALERGQSTVRIYSWDAATVSLGYFQKIEEFRNSDRFQNLPVVRRLSGGGAILHDRELTCSLALAPNHPLTSDPTRLYGIVHAVIIEQLAMAGVTTAMRGVDESQTDEPFLCFVRGDRHDILCAGHKVVGSAQRRRRGAILQHGSVILEASPHAAEIPGIHDLDPEAKIPPDLATAVGTAIAAQLGEFSESNVWSAEARSRIDELHEKYGHPEQKP